MYPIGKLGILFFYFYALLLCLLMGGKLKVRGNLSLRYCVIVMIVRGNGEDV